MTTKQRAANSASASVAQTQFSLWRDNKTDQEYKLTGQELADRFFASDLFKKWSDDPWTYLDYVWRLFVGAKDGLDSVMEMEDYSRVGGYIEGEYRRRKK